MNINFVNLAPFRQPSYWTSCHVSFIWLPSFESFSARWNWISVHLLYGDPRDLFV